MKWLVPPRKDLRLMFAWCPVPLEGGGWAWLEWVVVSFHWPRAHGVCGEYRTFGAIPKEPDGKPEAANVPTVAIPTNAPPPKPNR